MPTIVSYTHADDDLLGPRAWCLFSGAFWYPRMNPGYDDAKEDRFSLCMFSDKQGLPEGLMSTGHPSCKADLGDQAW